MLKNFIFVALGSALGGAIRYAVSLIPFSGNSAFPLATLLVNVVGSALLGAFSALVLKFNFSEQIALFLTVGLCGGFTTFSTFTKEIFLLFQTSPLLALGYVFLSLALSLLAFFLFFQILK